MTSWRPSRALLLILAAGAVGAAGCGSGSAGSSSPTTAARGGFIAQLNAACRTDIAAIRAAPKTVAGESPAERAFIQRLRTLKPPAALRPTFSRYVSLLEQNLASFERHDVAAGKQQRPQIARVLSELRQAGATDC